VNGVHFVPLLGKSGWFRKVSEGYSTLTENSEDGVWLAPGYGIKLWDGGHHLFPPPDTLKPDAELKNNCNSWKWFEMLGSNRMDYYDVYQLK
jgi:hypothetical protein